MGNRCLLPLGGMGASELSTGVGSRGLELLGLPTGGLDLATGVGTCNSSELPAGVGSRGLESLDFATGVGACNSSELPAGVGIRGFPEDLGDCSFPAAARVCG